MTTKSKVAVVRTTPETVLDDYGRLLDIADYRSALKPDTTTVLKNNISWHLLYPSANTTPWQIEGVTRKMQADGFDDLVVVENRTVVTKAKKGEHLNNFTPVHEKYGLPVKYNFNLIGIPRTPDEPGSSAGAVGSAASVVDIGRAPELRYV